MKTTNKYRGKYVKSKNILTIIEKTNLCKLCLTDKCKKEQPQKNPNCKKIRDDISYPELINLLEDNRKAAEVLSNKKPTPKTSDTKQEGKFEGSSNNDNPVEIKPEERFTEISDDEDSTDLTEEEVAEIDNFTQRMKEIGIPIIEEKKVKKSIAATTMVKRGYLMEPEILPYQDILNNEQVPKDIKPEPSPQKAIVKKISEQGTRTRAPTCQPKTQELAKQNKT